MSFLELFSGHLHHAVFMIGLILVLILCLLYRIRYISAQRDAEKAMAITREIEGTAKQTSFFLNAISHDLRTPLNALMLHVDLAEKALDHEDYQLVRESLSDMHESAAAAGELLNSLLDYARMEMRSGGPHFTTFPLREFMEHTARGFNHCAVRKGLYVRVGICPHIALTTDKLKLFRVVSNLVDNAIKFTQTGGVELSANEGSDKVSISVVDTGLGIAPQERQRIFEAFYQIGNHERDRSKGFGLGLTICRRLVEQLGGQIDVQSEEGYGSRFIINVPKKTGATDRGQCVNPEGSGTLAMLA